MARRLVGVVLIVAILGLVGFAIKHGQDANSTLAHTHTTLPGATAPSTTPATPALATLETFVVTTTAAARTILPATTAPCIQKKALAAHVGAHDPATTKSTDITAWDATTLAAAATVLDACVPAAVVHLVLYHQMIVTGYAPPAATCIADRLLPRVSFGVFLRLAYTRAGHHLTVDDPGPLLQRAVSACAG